MKNQGCESIFSYKNIHWNAIYCHEELEAIYVSNNRGSGFKKRNDAIYHYFHTR